MLRNDDRRPDTDTPAGRRRRWRWAFGLVAAVSLVILFAPRSGVPTAPLGVDKLVHLLLFAGLAGTAVLAGARRRWLVPALLAYAVVSELIQSSPLLDRSGSAVDALADALGVLLGLLAAGWLWRRSTSRL